MIQKDYSFHWAPQHSVKSYFAKFVRQFGVAADVLPTYMPVDSIKTNVQFEAVAKTLEKNIYAKEDEFYKKKGYLPSFQDMMAINEQYRKADCELYLDWRNQRSSAYDDRNVPDLSKFHFFFNPKSNSCN